MAIDYEFEIAAKRAENSALWAYIGFGRKLMVELAAAADAAAINHEPFPDELNARISRWIHADPYAEATSP